MAAFYVVMGVAVLAVSLVTNYQYSPKNAPRCSRRRVRSPPESAARRLITSTPGKAAGDRGRGPHE